MSRLHSIFSPHVTRLTMNEVEDVSDIHPCDKNTRTWCYRFSVLVLITVLLLSMSIILWETYSTMLNEFDDNETPSVIGMWDGCRNNSWNVQQINKTHFGLLFMENIEIEFPHYLQTVYNCNIHFPYVECLERTKCVSFILWRTV